MAPYLYISGGVNFNEETSENEESDKFFALRKQRSKILELINLPQMIDSKSHHCMLEVKYLEGICAIGGTDSKDCEYYNFKNKEWKNLPDLNDIRENCSCCVVNEKYLYCFCGYNNQTCKFYVNIERLYLKKKR